MKFLKITFLFLFSQLTYGLDLNNCKKFSGNNLNRTLNGTDFSGLERIFDDGNLNTHLSDSKVLPVKNLYLVRESNEISSAQFKNSCAQTIEVGIIKSQIHLFYELTQKMIYSSEDTWSLLRPDRGVCIYRSKVSLRDFIVCRFK